MLSTQYIAGFFDGEGCINIYATQGKRGQLRTRLRISIGNTNRDVLEQIQLLYGGAMRALPGKNSPVFLLTLDSTKAIGLLSAMLPYSIVKKDQIILALEYWSFVHSDPNDRYERVERNRGGHRKKSTVIAQELLYKKELHDLKHVFHLKQPLLV